MTTAEINCQKNLKKKKKFLAISHNKVYAKLLFFFLIFKEF